MIEFILGIIFIIIYLVPFNGFIKLTENQKEMRKNISNFDKLIEDEEIVKEDGTSDIIDSSFSAYDVLGDLELKEDKSKSSSNDYVDIDISKL